MRRIAIAAGLSVALAFGLCVRAQAAPLELKQVSAAAKWLGHVDFDALNASTVVQNAIKKVQEKHNIEAHMAMVQAMVGMDPRKDLHGITVYGNEIGKPQGVLIAHVKLDQKRLQALAANAPHVETTKYGDYELRSHTHKTPHGTHTIAGAFYDAEHIVIASGVDDLKAAIDVLNGKSPSVGGDGPLAGQVPAGTSVLFRIAGINQADLKCKSPLPKQTESFRFAIGESDGQSFYRARAVMTNAEVVGELDSIVKGGRALALLHLGDDAQAKKLADAVKTETDGKTLTVSWNASANDVWEVAQKQAKIIGEHMAEMRKHAREHGKGQAGDHPDRPRDGDHERDAKREHGGKHDHGGHGHHHNRDKGHGDKKADGEKKGAKSKEEF